MTVVVSQPVRHSATALPALYCLVLAACNATMPKLQVANVQASEADLAGQWTGTYACPDGLTGVRLAMTATVDKIVRPTGSMPVRVSAAVISSPDRLAGTVTDAGCGRFEVERLAIPIPPLALP